MECMPTPDDHFKVVILVRQIGCKNAVVFNRVFERLTRQKTIQVSETPRRFFHANFVTTVNNDLSKFAELHCHHRILGVVGVGSAISSTAETDQVKLDEPSAGSSTRKHSLVGPLSLDEVKNNYEKLKSEFASHLVDSRCILLGYNMDEVHTCFSNRDVFSYPSLECSDDLELGVREYLRTIYFVLESKRMDLSFEKMDPPPCILLPEEEKFRIGLENKASKTYRKKCLGRCRKHHADFTMMAGCPQTALESYQTSIELLKSSNDLLWLAGAYEGWACAAMAIRFENYSDLSSTTMSRTTSMTPQQMRDAQEGRAINSRTHGSKERIEFSQILERFENALENYSKFSFAALIEYNCMMKAVSLFQRQREYVQMETFHRDHVGKYLDDSFTRLDHLAKSAICNNSAALYKSTGFHRKSSFFARLGVLFRLHVADGELRTVQDYKVVYPILYKTLAGYGIPDDVRENKSSCNTKGPVQMQIKALHEVYTAAIRAELTQAAIRHLCYLIQVYYEEMEPSMLTRLFDDLNSLVKSESAYVLGQRISLQLGNIILPPMQLTRFPSISQPELCSLPPHLAPTVIKKDNFQPAIFIYSPFQAKKNNNEITWVVNSPCAVSVLVYNCRSVELTVRELCLVSEGCSFEPVPVRLILPAAGPGVSPARIKLIGVPRSAGKLTITGYTCEVFGLRNVCKLEPTSGSLTVDVLPQLATIKISSSMTRAPIQEEEEEPSCESTVYSGQTFEHSLTVQNTSSIGMRRARLQIWQPKVSGGPALIELLADDESVVEDEVAFDLGPHEKREIKFRIFGIDPTATADDDNGEEKIVETVLPLASTAAEEVLPDGGQHDLIPYIGRLLTCQFVIRYESDVDGQDGEIYERSSRLSLAVCIVPALTVSAWHVLPGDGPFSRYIVVDVTNSTEHDAELVYSLTRRMNVLPKETCRVPLLSPCCADVAGRAFYVATQKDSHMMQRMEVERLRRTLERHVARHLDIRWTIPAMNLNGLVPVGALLSSVSLLKQLVLPAISLDIAVNGVPYLSEDDINVGIGEVITLKVAIISSLDYNFDGTMFLDCYQEISNQFGTIDRLENVLLLGGKKLPFTVPSCTSKSALPAPRCVLVFQFLFKVEGNHKLRPVIVSRNSSESLFSDDVFVTPIGFSVCTKNH
ncbi:unnamed protein product [Auanema sp. JU1783]|nr:unnamed protein product [Auanema sp. JU1783]